MPEATENPQFITFEGGEGSGKSTQIQFLKDFLSECGVSVVLTREPGGSPGAEMLRKLLVEGEPGLWDGVSEALMHFAARRDHVVRTIKPALERGEWVLCDRFVDSTIAYQGYGHGLSLDIIESLRAISIGDFAPDLTLILDASVETGLGRAAARGEGGDRYERMDRQFHQRLREGFLSIAAAEPNRCALIDAEADIESVRGEITAFVRRRFSLDAP
ncbi:MAG: dTMP kinase [Alphaproteobacteria bacterium]